MLERDVDFLDIFVLGRIMNDKKKIINFYGVLRNYTGEFYKFMFNIFFHLEI